jgi:hypothetical protein
MIDLCDEFDKLDIKEKNFEVLDELLAIENGFSYLKVRNDQIKILITKLGKMVLECNEYQGYNEAEHCKFLNLVIYNAALLDFIDDLKDDLIFPLLNMFVEKQNAISETLFFSMSVQTLKQLAIVNVFDSPLHTWFKNEGFFSKMNKLNLNLTTVKYMMEIEETYKSRDRSFIAE